jgi:hypothetical protein
MATEPGNPPKPKRKRNRRKVLHPWDIKRTLEEEIEDMQWTDAQRQAMNDAFVAAMRQHHPDRETAA